MSNQCLVCENEVDWTEVRVAFEAILDQADRFGAESLTERQQAVYLGKCCSPECYEHLQ